jgi:hypothetical protein
MGVPLFKHTMITFAAVFLLKVAWKWSGYVNIDPAQVLNLVQEVVYLVSSPSPLTLYWEGWMPRLPLSPHILPWSRVLTNQQMRSVNVNRRHLVYHIANGLASNVEKFRKRIPCTASPLHPGEDGSSQLASSANSQYAGVFDDVVVGDGLSFAMDDWLFPTSLDGFSGYQTEGMAGGLWSEVQSGMEGNSSISGNW